MVIPREVGGFVEVDKHADPVGAAALEPVQAEVAFAIVSYFIGEDQEFVSGTVSSDTGKAVGRPHLIELDGEAADVA